MARSASSPRFGKLCLGILLVPFCFLTTQTFLQTFAVSGTGSRFWTGPELWCFAAGALAWFLYFILGKRPVSLYVLGHELTHALFAYLCGADVTSLKVSGKGGYVQTTKTNALISLSPYLFPFYTLIILAVTSLLSLVFDLYHYFPDILFGIGLRPIWVFLALIGCSWAFHLTFTIWMLGKNQPDLEQNGAYFSLILIYLVNLLILCAFLVLASPNVSPLDFIKGWGFNAAYLGSLAGGLFSTVFDLLRHLFGIDPRPVRS